MTHRAQGRRKHRARLACRGPGVACGGGHEVKVEGSRILDTVKDHQGDICEQDPSSIYTPSPLYRVYERVHLIATWGSELGETLPGEF